jgi:hypothetical protein
MSDPTVTPIELDHRTLEPYQIHAPWSFTFNNVLEREAAEVYTEDLYKLAIQVDEASLWVLTSTEPRWVRISTPNVPTVPGGVAGGHLRGFFPNPQVVDDSHRHEPGISIPAYPTTLPPSGYAGGDFEGTFPNPFLRPTGVLPGNYTNPTVAVDSKGRILSATSHPLGEANTGANIGLGVPLYAGKDGTILQFNTLRAGFNSGLSLQLGGGELSINSPGLALLSGATFTGPIISPSMETPHIKVSSSVCPFYEDGGGSNWSPSSSNGSHQQRTVYATGTLDAFKDNPPGGFQFLFLLSVSSGATMTLSSTYKVPRGLNRTLAAGRHLVGGMVISSSLYVVSSLGAYLE